MLCFLVLVLNFVFVHVLLVLFLGFPLYLVLFLGLFFPVLVFVVVVRLLGVVLVLVLFVPGSQLTSDNVRVYIYTILICSIHTHDG